MDKELSPDKARQWKAALNEARMRDAGSCPASVSRLIDNMNEPKVTWRQVLPTQITYNKIGDYEYVPPESAFFHQGISLAKMNFDDDLTIGFVIDASGSIGHEEIQDAMSELIGIAEQFKTFTITVMSFDGILYKPQIFTRDNAEEIIDYKIRGGGGTCFSAPLDWIAGETECEGVTCDGEAFDAIVFFTDGYPGDGWQEHRADTMNMIWLITTQMQAPWGVTLTYDKYS